MASQYASDRVRVIAQSNAGPAASRNRALREASGNYIQYLDADDLLHPDKISAQLKALESTPGRTVAVCPTCYFDDGTEPTAGRFSEGSRALNSADPIQWLVDLWLPNKGWGMVQPGAWLSPVEVLKNAGPWDEKISLDDDGEYFTRVLVESDGIQYTGSTCVYYRQHNQRRVSAKRSHGAMAGWLRSIDSKYTCVFPQTKGKQREQAAQGLARQYWSVAIEAYPAHPDIASNAEARAMALGFPYPLHPISKNGWKAVVSRSVHSWVGWRVARWCQVRYHQVRRAITS